MSVRLRARGAKVAGLAALREMVEVLLPGRCVGCGERLLPEGGGEPVCSACPVRLRRPSWPRCPRCHFPIGTGRRREPDCLACRPWPPALRAARWAVALEPPADAFVHGLKYEGWKRLAAFMARHMAGLDLPRETSGGREEETVVVPVPTTQARERARGYNQARLLADAYAAETGRVVENALVRREGGGGTQVALDPAERRANVAEAFRPAPGASRGVGGRGVILIDDVLTTGATAGAAAETLERAGATGVTVVTFARALPGGADL